MREKKYHLAFVDDQRELLNLVSASLTGLGYEVSPFFRGMDFVSMLQDTDFVASLDIVLLDIMLPDIDATEIVKDINEVYARAEYKKSLVVMYSSRGDELSKVKFLELGASGYIEKNASVYEIHARLKALLRFRDELTAGTITTNGSRVILNYDDMTATINEETVHLTKTEFAIFNVLIDSEGSIISKDSLRDSAELETGRSVYDINSHISRLRRKSNTLHENYGNCIVAKYGVGYRFVQPKGELE